VYFPAAMAVAMSPTTDHRDRCFVSLGSQLVNHRTGQLDAGGQAPLAGKAEQPRVTWIIDLGDGVPKQRTSCWGSLAYNGCQLGLTVTKSGKDCLNVVTRRRRFRSGFRKRVLHWRLQTAGNHIDCFR